MMSARWIDAVEEELVQRGEAFFQLGGAGHEASAVLADHLGPQDWLQPHYRSRALLVRRGIEPERFFDGLLSTARSDSAGRQMPAFLHDPELHVLPMTVPTGNGLLHAVGVAREVAHHPDRPIVMAGVGDGTTQQGEVMEAIAEAAREGLPVLFWIEDNGYAISTHTSGRTIYDTVTGPASEFLGAPIVRADGRDPMSLDIVAARAVQDVREARRPVVLVAQVERLTHHTNADDESVYRTDAERAAARAGDPIAALRDNLIAEGVPADDLVALDREVEAEVRAAAARAIAADDPVASRRAIRPVSTDVIARASAPAEPADGPPRTMLEAMRDVLARRLEADERVSLTGQDIEDPKGDVFGLTRGLSTAHPGRVTNAPLSESTIVGTAIGRALAGGRPVAMVQFADFLPLAYNQIASELATIYWRTNGAWSAPVVILAPCGAYRPGLGPFHAQTMEATFAHIPGLDVAMPSTADDAAGMLEAALDGDRPTLILYPKTCLNDPLRASRVQGAHRPVVPGHAVVRHRGDDVTIVAWGSTAPIAERAAAVLDAAGVGVDLIDLRGIAPWDMEAVTASAARTRRLVVVHEDNLTGGFGAEVVAHVSDHLEGELTTRRIARPDTWVPNNYANQLEVLPSTRDVVEAVAAMIGGLEVTEAEGAQEVDGVLAVEATGSSPADQQVMVVEWLVAEGDTVTEGQVIAEAEGDKATFELAAPAAGEIFGLHEELESVPVGTVLASITLAPGAAAARRRMPLEPTLRVRRVPGHQPSPLRTAAPAPAATALPVGLSGFAVRAGGRILTNADIAARFPGRTEADIVRRTGIRQRPVLAPGEDISALAARAAREALEAEGMALGDLEAIIAATGTPTRLSPSVACLVQNALAEADGPADVAASDVSAACSGYLYAMQSAHDMLQQRPEASVLVITAEAMTRYVDPDDFDTVVVFGDAVTATVVHGPARAGDSPVLLHRPVLSASGDDGSVIRHGPADSDHLFMDGPRVYTRAVREMLRMLDRAAAQSGASTADLMHVIPHQANGRIISSVQARSGLPADRFVVNVENWGNTSSSTIPIAIAEHLPSGPMGLGGLVAFGAGLTSGAAIVEFTGND